MVRAATNDENARPEVNPNEVERTRFGFKRQPRASQAARRLSQYAVAVREPEEEQSIISASPLVTTMPATECDSETAAPNLATKAPVALMPLLEGALGDPEVKMRLVRMRPAANKYDFKGRINELSEQNRALKATVAEDVDRQRALTDAVATLEKEINWRLRQAEGDAAGARQQLDERGKLVEVLQDAVRAVWREEGAPSDAKRELDDEFQSRQYDLQRACVVEAARADKAEALIHEKERCLEEVKKAALRSEEAALAREKALEAENCRLRERLQEAEMRVETSTRCFQEAREALQQMEETEQAREEALLQRWRKAGELVEGAGQILETSSAAEFQQRQRIIETATKEWRKVKAELLNANARIEELEARLSERA